MNTRVILVLVVIIQLCCSASVSSNSRSENLHDRTEEGELKSPDSSLGDRTGARKPVSSLGDRTGGSKLVIPLGLDDSILAGRTGGNKIVQTVYDSEKTSDASDEELNDLLDQLINKLEAKKSAKKTNVLVSKLAVLDTDGDKRLTNADMVAFLFKRDEMRQADRSDSDALLTEYTELTKYVHDIFIHYDTNDSKTWDETEMAAATNDAGYELTKEFYANICKLVGSTDKTLSEKEVYDVLVSVLLIVESDAGNDD